MNHAFGRGDAGCDREFARKDATTSVPYLGLALAFGLCLAVAAVLASADQASSAERKLPLGWSVNCEPLPSREVDPIVYPGEVGLAHLHDPFGQHLDPDMTYEKLRNDPTNCRFKNGTRVDDRSAYWIPSFYAEAGRKVPVRLANFYYRVKPGMNPNNIEPFPKGLKIIAGKADATGPQRQPAGYKPGKPIVEWKCFAPDNFSNEGHLPTDCGRDQHVAVSVTFPDCAKPGVTDSADHKSHMAYSTFNRCPSSHPKHVMQLNLFVVYDLHNGKGAYLSSSHKEPGEPKNAYGMHADFFDAWGGTQIRKLIRNCVYSGNGCKEADTTGR
jgi:Domain of unknown function (DUF1996)